MGKLSTRRFLGWKRTRMHLLKISKHRRRKWRILSSLSLQNCTRVQVDLLPRMVGKKMRCTVLYKLTSCKEMRMTCQKFYVDNRDPYKCKRGDTFTVKSKGRKPKAYCK